MGWMIAGLALAAALVVIYTVKAIVLLGRGIVLLAAVLVRGLFSLIR